MRALVIDADVVHRLLSKKSAKGFLLDVGDNLTRPLLADMRRVTANTVEELRQYPELRACLPEAENLLRFG